MGKLFLKLWLFLLATSFTSWQIQTHVFEWTQKQMRMERPRAPFLTVTADTLERVWGDVPQEQWPQRFASLSATYTYPAVLMSTQSLAQFPGMTDALRQSIESGANAHIPGKDGQPNHWFRRIKASNWVIRVQLPADPPLLVFGTLTPTTFTWMVESSLYALAVLLWLSLFWRDLTGLMRTADRFGQGDLSARSTLRASSALRPMANAYNAMSERVGRLLRSHRELTNAISHEFRTPIARLRFHQQLALDAVDIGAKDKQIRAMDNTIDEMEGLAAELLEYAKLERSAPTMDLREVKATHMIESAINEARDLAAAQGRSIEFSQAIVASTMICDARYMQRALSNLLRNALVHAQNGVRVKAETEGGVAQLVVEDDGPGIPLAERERVFEPFTRLDASRDRATGGIGLGLAIVRQVARWHGGDVHIGESDRGGARVAIEWPLNPKLQSA
jgi:two-component system, OmpR family, sensor kinase ParS